MTPVVTQTTPLAPGEPGTAHARRHTAAETYGAQPQTTSAPAMSRNAQTVAAPTPVSAGNATDRVVERRTAAASETADARSADRDTPHGIDEGVDMPRPAPPLKSFAQIPTRMMEEIARLRDEAEEASRAAAPGKDDPTPMPAPAEAIAPSDSPVDRAGDTMPRAGQLGVETRV